MSPQNKLILAGGAGLLLWLALRRGPQGPAVVPRTPDSTVAEGAPLSVGDFWLTSGTGLRADQCDLPDDRHEVWSEAQRACVGKWHADRANWFVQQVVTPASRVTVREAMTPEALSLAARFLSNQLDRSSAPWTYGQTKAVNDFNDAGEMRFAQGMLSLLAPITAILGAGGDSVANVQGTVDKARADYQSAVLALSQAAADTDVLSFALQPTSDDPVFAQFADAESVDSWRIDPRGPSIDFGFDPLRFPWGDVYVRMRLLKAGNYGGWYYPFLSRELGYDNPADKTLTPEKVAKVARLWRTLDVLGAITRPIRQAVLVDGNYEPGSRDIGVAGLNVKYRLPPGMKGLYAYKVGGLELWGASLPAHPDDGAIDLSNELGRDLAESGWVAPHIDSTVAASETWTPKTPLSDVGDTVAQSTYVPPSAPAPAPEPVPEPAPTLAQSTYVAPAPAPSPTVSTYSSGSSSLLRKLGLLST